MPSCLTRVTEYMPEVVAFVKGIIDKGYAYESSGSVYFDTTKYKADGHRYPKIVPEVAGDLLREGDCEWRELVLCCSFFPSHSLSF